MSNILKIKLGKEQKITTKPLYQYDYGQILKFIDTQMPSAYEVHFSNYERGESTTQVATSNEVAIPDVYFKSGRDIYVWVYIHTGVEDGETEYQIIIPIVERATITDEEPTPEQASVIEQTIAALNSAVSTISSSEAVAAAAASDAEIYRDTTRNYMERTEGYKQASEAAASLLVNCSAIANTLAPGSDAIASYSYGVFTFGIPQGEKGETGAAGPTGEMGPAGPTGPIGPTGMTGPVGPTGQQGPAGADGISPMVIVTEINDGYSVTITDAIHPLGQSFNIFNGQDGQDGKDGKDGQNGQDGKDGKDGQDGQNGQDGQDGTTFTPAVSSDGIISWTNDGGKQNPASVNITGPQGATGDSGVYYGTSTPTDPDVNVWIDPSGTSNAVSDVQINGTSIVNNGVANVPLMSTDDTGVAKVKSGNGIRVVSGALATDYASDTQAKAGTNTFMPIVPYNQHRAAFYGLAKAAGDSTQASSSNAVGTYTEEAKAAIRAMLGITIYNGGVT